MSRSKNPEHDPEFIAYLSHKLDFNFAKYGLPKLHGLSLWNSQHNMYFHIPGDFLELLYLQWRQINTLKLRPKSVPKPDKRGRGGK